MVDDLAEQATPVVIELAGVEKSFGRQVVLRGVDLQVREGRTLVIVGASGQGKSVIIKHMLGLIRPDRGEVKVFGRNLNRLNRREKDEVRENFGVLFQNAALFDSLNVFDNVALPLIIAGYRHQQVGRRVRAALDKVGLLSKEKLLPITLSGGEQQRVGIARAVVNKPMLLLADEPTGNLDPALSREVMALFSQFNDVGVSVLIASHDITLIEELDYPVLSLDHGRLSITETDAA